MTDEDLVDILDTARERNGRENITGMLLYRDQYFVQVLEGEAGPVEKLYDDICTDERHGNIVLVEKEPIKERTFAEWSMGFTNLDKVNPAEHPGLTDFLTQPVPSDYFSKDMTHAKRLLMTFKAGAF
jgi:hypothetical protein